MPSLADNRASSCLELALCWGSDADGELDEYVDQFLWSQEIGPHSTGESSQAVVKANASIEDHSLVEVAGRATFVGVFDGHGGEKNLDAVEYAGGVLWSQDLEAHSGGEFSRAVIQANSVVEDHSHVNTAGGALFVGVYDGHGGDFASSFVSGALFPRFEP